MEFTDIIIAKRREAGSKGNARKLRAQGLVPAVTYGPAQEPTYVALDPRVFVEQRKKYGRAHIYTVDMEGKSFKALIKDIQQNPLTHAVEHVDLYAVDMQRPLRVDVRIELTGKAKGIVEGGILSQVLRTVEVRGLPGDIPQVITADVTELGIGDSLHLSDIKLPEGVKFTSQRDEAVAVVTAPEAEEVAAPVATAEAAAAGAAAPGAAAAEGAAEPAKADEKEKDKK